MSDTFTSSGRIQLQGTGNNNTTWGQIADTQFQNLEAMITGDNGGGISINGLSSYTLSANQGTADQARQLAYIFTGTLAQQCTIVLPGVVKFGYVVNNTDGGQNIVLTTGGAGANLLVPPKQGWCSFYCDGTNITALPTFGIEANYTGPVAASAYYIGFGASQFYLGLVGNKPTLNFDASQYIQFVPGVGLYLSTGGQINLTAPTNITVSNPLAGSGFVATTSSTDFQAWHYGISLACPAGGISAQALFTTSDARAKTDVRDLTEEEGMVWLRRARPRHFSLDGKPSAGFIAQEDYLSGYTEAIVPVPDEGPKFAESDGIAAGGYRLIRDYQADSAYLVAALQRALGLIERLQARVEALETR